MDELFRKLSNFMMENYRKAIMKLAKTCGFANRFLKLGDEATIFI